ncbi:hypothetical protein [Clostridium intestinale]|uniref:Uncharacterized protein n=1 Tax=Clostridium intestinale URNW TaxID=1294142 RepID=U2N8Q9_9CLOT|nr:hypothetical protein [Clostridium intestinale]ERK31902.1 hypothetical protein CINTURNW_1021 [Clostridium intestinale URNW]
MNTYLNNRQEYNIESARILSEFESECGAFLISLAESVDNNCNVEIRDESNGNVFDCNVIDFQFDFRDAISLNLQLIRDGEELNFPITITEVEENLLPRNAYKYYVSTLDNSFRFVFRNR